MMKHLAFLAGVIVVLGFATELRASGPIGVHAIVEKVTVEENNAGTPRVQIAGIFSLAAKTDSGDRDYSRPQRGYLYLEVGKKDAQDICRKEWADLDKVAGTGQPVGFGDSHEVRDIVRIRKENEKAEKPDVFPLGNGVVKIRDNADFAPVKDLVAFPAQIDPSDNCVVPKGKATLTVRNIPDKKHAKATYVFEIEAAGGDKEKSQPIEAGDKVTKWTPKMELKGGTKYTWRVHAVDDKWEGPVSSAVIETKK
jgi:hypothetical protein